MLISNIPNVSLLAFYGDKPTQLSKLVYKLQTYLANLEILQGKFIPDQLEQVHGTIIGCEGLKTELGVINKWFYELKQREFGVCPTGTLSLTTCSATANGVLAAREATLRSIDNDLYLRLGTIGGKLHPEIIQAIALDIRNILDTAIGIPGTKFRLGLDPILGLIPGGGDLITAGLSAYMIYLAASFGLDKSEIFKMFKNVMIETAIGSIPIADDIFDAYFKANIRNLEILEKHIERAETQEEIIES